MHSIRKPSTDGLANGRRPKSPRYAEGEAVGRYRVVGIVGRTSYFNGETASGQRRVDSAWVFRVACLVCAAESECTQTVLRAHERGKRIMPCAVCRERTPIWLGVPLVSNACANDSEKRAAVGDAGDDPVVRAMALWATPPSAIEEKRPCLR